MKTGFIKSRTDQGNQPSNSSAGGTPVVRWGVRRYHIVSRKLLFQALLKHLHGSLSETIAGWVVGSGPYMTNSIKEIPMDKVELVAGCA